MTATIYETSAVAATVTPTVIAADGTTTGSAVDLSRNAYGFTSALIVAVAGDIADGTYTISVEHSDDDSTWTGVPTARLQGSFADITASGALQAVGYTAAKRYVRAKVTAASTDDGGTVGVLVVLGGANRTVEHG